jgi:hypothetical protein
LAKVVDIEDRHLERGGFSTLDRAAQAGGGVMMKYWVVAVLTAVAGCQTVEEVEISLAQSVPPSPVIKAAIVNDARDFLVDPYSIRDAEISNVQLNSKSGLRWLCVKANARNALGGYAGRQAIEVVVRGERLVGNVPSSAACSNPSLKWQPFPELESLRDI